MKIIYRLIILIILSGNCFSQEAKGISIVGLEGNKGKRWAICIGISDYVDSTIVDLKKARNDAYGIGNILKSNGQFDNVYVMTDDLDYRNNLFPSKLQIEKTIDYILTMANQEDLIVIAFSGHGVTDNQGEGYFLPVDADLTNLYASCIKISQITKKIQEKGIKKSLLLFDACREEFQEGKSVNIRGLKEQIFTQAEVSAVFYATKGGWFSYEDDETEYGVFTRFIIEGLNGSADRNKDHLVSFSELEVYVQKKVAEWATVRMLLQKPYTKIYNERYGDLVLTTYNTIYAQQYIFMYICEGNDYIPCFLTDKREIIEFRQLQDLISWAGSPEEAYYNGEIVIFPGGMNSNTFTGDIYKYKPETEKLLNLTNSGNVLQILDISANKKILFRRKNNDNADLCMVDFTGKNLQVLQKNFPTYFCRFLNNNEAVVYYINKNNKTFIYTEDISNYQIRLIKELPGNYMISDLSAKNNRLLLYKSAEDKVACLDLMENIIFFEESIKGAYFYRLSLDGNYITYVKDSEIYIKNLNNKTSRRLTNLDLEYGAVIYWFKNDKILFDFGKCPPDLNAIYEINTKNNDLTKIAESAIFSLARACPFLYIKDGNKNIYKTEILRDIVGEKNKKNEKTPIDNIAKSNNLEIRIAEERKEISCLDSIALYVNGKKILPENCCSELKDMDDLYLILNKGDFIDLKFKIDEKDILNIYLECSGYYLPVY